MWTTLFWVMTSYTLTGDYIHFGEIVICIIWADSSLMNILEEPTTSSSEELRELTFYP
jgi:hypothetical protein